MKPKLTKDQKKALFKNPLLQTQEFKKKWIRVLDTEINRKLIRTWGISNDGIFVQLEDGEWMHWKLSPAKSREALDKINNQAFGKLSENQLKAERLRNEDNEQRNKEFLQCLQQPKKPMTAAVKRMIANRKPVARWGHGSLAAMLAEARQERA